MHSISSALLFAVTTLPTNTGSFFLLLLPLLLLLPYSSASTVAATAATSSVGGRLAVLANIVLAAVAFTAEVDVGVDLFVDDGMFDPRQYRWDREAGLVEAGSKYNTSRALSIGGTRGLATTSSANCGTGSSSEPCCIECFGLSYCDVLNGYKVEDKYYPGEPTILGSCENYEDRASRLDVFGAAKTFRDTDACREMVYDYTCLWWGSDNEMYDNRCGVEAQVYPCRSYCVQLAKTCANNVVEWLQLCRSIDCPPTDEECVPGPYTQDPDEACYLYEYHSPLNACSRTSNPGATLVLITALGVLSGTTGLQFFSGAFGLKKLLLLR